MKESNRSRPTSLLSYYNACQHKLQLPAPVFLFLCLFFFCFVCLFVFALGLNFLLQGKYFAHPSGIKKYQEINTPLDQFSVKTPSIPEKQMHILHWLPKIFLVTQSNSRRFYCLPSLPSHVLLFLVRKTLALKPLPGRDSDEKQRQLI